MFNPLRAACVLVSGMTAAILISACGGGGGSSATLGSSQIAITAANAPQVSAETVSLGGNVGGASRQSGSNVSAASVGSKVQGVNLAAQSCAKLTVPRVSSDLNKRKFCELRLRQGRRWWRVV